MKGFSLKTFIINLKNKKTWEYLQEKTVYYTYIARIRFQKTGGF